MRNVASRAHFYLVTLNVVSVLVLAYVTHLFRPGVFFYIIGFLLLIPASYLIIGKILTKTKKELKSQKLFVSNIDHELRDSMSSIHLDSEVVLKDLEAGHAAGLSKEKSGELMKVLEEDLEGLKNMANIIKNLSLMASFQYDNDQMELSRVNLNSLLERLCDSVSKQFADDKNISIELDSKSQAYILGSESALKQMITNLLKNAVLYTPKGGSVTASITSAKDRVKMSIKDNGVGISKKDLPHILDPFYRSKFGGVKNEKGSGLGLAIVAEIAKQHGAKVSVESALKEGTVVHVNFPAIAHNKN